MATIFPQIREAWRRRRVRREVAQRIYAAILVQARQPAFFTELDVPDSVSGRFDLLVLHIYLVLNRLRQGGEREHDLAQSLFDLFCADMDHNLRELGVADLSVGKKVREMIEIFYGQAAAYDAALASGDEEELKSAIGRNIYGKAVPGAPAVEALRTYISRQSNHLGGLPLDDLSGGTISFAPMEARELECPNENRT